MDFTQALTIVLVGLGGLAVNILAIWALLSKIKASNDNNTKRIVNEKAVEIEKNVEQQRNLALGSIKNDLKKEFESFGQAFQKFTEEQSKEHKENNAAIGLLKESLIEAYKRDIRAVYYKLRESGEISDADKAYVDKIFPKYKALGGNSDIEAKYKAMCDVYERVTQAAFDEARKKRQMPVSDLDLEFEESKEEV